MAVRHWPIVPQLRCQGLERFDFLGGCLPGKAAPTDLDQVIERNGHFLVIECKRPGQGVHRGQAILFDKLVEISDGRVRVLVVCGHPPGDVKSSGWWRGQQESCDVHDVRDLVRRWYDWASRQRVVAA